MDQFTTKTPTPLTGRVFESFGTWVVTFGTDDEPDLIKVLYLGPDEAAARAEYGRIEKHYRDREKNPVVREENDPLSIRDHGAQLAPKRQEGVTTDDREMGKALLRKELAKK